MMTTKISICILLVALTGCTSKEGFYRNLYDGMQSRENAVNPAIDYRPHSTSTDVPMPYREYQSERKKLLDNTATNQ